MPALPRSYVRAAAQEQSSMTLKRPRIQQKDEHFSVPLNLEGGRWYINYNYVKGSLSAEPCASISQHQVSLAIEEGAKQSANFLC